MSPSSPQTGIPSFKGANLALPRPDRVGGPLAWEKADLGDEYILQLSPDDLLELDTALNSFKRLGLNGDEVKESNFILPTLGDKLHIGAAKIHFGRGVLLIRGVNADIYSVEDNVILYLGISSYIGDKRGMQNKKGNMLSHVTDSKAWTVPHAQRHGIHTNGGLPFHNDMGSDILALQVRACADHGGETFLASAWTIYNDLVQSDPATIKALFEPNWPIQVSGQGRHVLAPLMQFHDSNLMLSVDAARLGPQPFADSKISEGLVSTVPSLTDEQSRALDVLLHCASRHEAQISLEKGDILFFNNWAIMHRRAAYQDDSATSRHLVRLWLRNSSLGWTIPPSMAVPWLAAFGENSTVDRVYPLEPMPVYKTPIYTAGSAAFVLEESDDEE